LKISLNIEKKKHKHVKTNRKWMLTSKNRNQDQFLLMNKIKQLQKKNASINLLMIF